MNIKKFSRGFTRTIIKISIYAVFIFLICYIGFRAFGYGQEVFSDKGIDKSPGTDVYITIPKGSSAKEIGKLLESYGLIDDSFIFRLQTVIYESKEFVGGEYKFNTSYNAEKIISMLKNGPQQETTKEGEAATTKAKKASKGDSSDSK